LGIGTRFETPAFLASSCQRVRASSPLSCQKTVRTEGLPTHLVPIVTTIKGVVPTRSPRELAAPMGVPVTNLKTSLQSVVAAAWNVTGIRTFTCVLCVGVPWFELNAQAEGSYRSGRIPRVCAAEGNARAGTRRPWGWTHVNEQSSTITGNDMAPHQILEVLTLRNPR